MNLILGYDTETTKMILFRDPSDDPRQPRIVSIAAQLIDADIRKIVSSMDVIVKPGGWEYDPEATAIHGITKEYAMDVGVPEQTALDMFMALHDRCDLRFGHVQSFDARIIRIALKRYRDDAAADAWKECSAECTAKLAKEAMGLTRQPNLRDAYAHFMGHPMPDAHTALGDVNACVAVYWRAKDGE